MQERGGDMKKKNVLLFCILISLCLTSCVYRIQGIENFTPGDSTLEITYSLLPEGFLSMFPYERGDYDYYEIWFDPDNNFYSFESYLIYMVYDEETYIQAKEYFWGNMPVDTDHPEKYKNYVFMENIDHVYDHKGAKIYLGYSDEDRILLAVGTHMEIPYTHTTIGEYMETYFPFYNFEEGKIERGSNRTEKPNISETVPFTGEISKPGTEPPVKTKIG